MIKATIAPFVRRASASRLDLTERGKLSSIELVASVLNLEYDICKRELASAKAALIEAGIDEALITTRGNKLHGIGEGNTCYAKVTHETRDMQNHKAYHSEIFTLLGEKRSSAEKIGGRLSGVVKRYLFDTDALIDEYLTDQLLLPLTLSGGGVFTARDY